MLPLPESADVGTLYMWVFHAIEAADFGRPQFYRDALTVQLRRDDRLRGNRVREDQPPSEMMRNALCAPCHSIAVIAP